MDTLIKIRHLLCFLEVSRLKSVSRAAQRLAVTQPAVSKSIRELETILGVSLLDRTKQGVFLSPFGEILQKYASSSIRELREGISLIAQARSGEHRTVVVGMLPTAAGPLMPPAVLAFKAEGGRAPIRLVEGTNETFFALLRSGEMDFVVGRLADPRLLTGFAFEPLYSERLCFVVRPLHAGLLSEDAAIGSLAEGTILLPTPGTIIRREADLFLHGFGIISTPDLLESNSIPFGRSLVLASDTVWLVPFGAVEADLRSGALAELPITRTLEAPVGLTTSTGSRLPPAAELLIECVRSVAEEIRKRRNSAPSQ